MAKMLIHFSFSDVPLAEQDRIRIHVERAIASGEILSCSCPAIDALIYETRPPDFQASMSCGCGLMRPLYSSTADTED